MAATTMLHGTTHHRMAAILAQTVLEWTLISLLLLNSLFSYLLSKFASFFGLHPPCLFCNRIDHLFEHGRSYLDMLCHDHVAEVSRLRYCSRHCRLMEAGRTCGDCRDSAGWEDVRCSCCGVAVDTGFCSPYLVLKSSLGIAHKGNLVKDGSEEGSECKDEVLGRKGDMGGLAFDRQQEEDAAVLVGSDAFVAVDNDSIEVDTQCSKSVVDVAERSRVSVGLFDSAMMVEKNHVVSTVDGEDDQRREWTEQVEGCLAPVVETEDRSYSKIVEMVDSLDFDSAQLMLLKIKDKSCSEILKLVDVVEDQSYVPLVKESAINCLANCPRHIPRSIEVIPRHINPRHINGVGLEILPSTEDSDETQAFEDETKAMDSEADCEVSIGSEIGDPKDIDQPCFFDPASVPLAVEVQCSKGYTETTDRDLVFESEPVELVLRGAESLSICGELNEAEQDQAPETFTSIEKIHAMHKTFFFERRESGMESMDGCIAGEFEGGEPLATERLKSALKTKHKALSALYAELEEERSASAIAANQTMAMITRLQEEKAAMQMEALQYQRMMEQQSEYDQEALQLLNELMMKREKENQELEKELELYRKKVLLLEAKERRMRRSKGSDRSGTSSPSSIAEDSDDHSFDFHEGDECFNRLDESNQNPHTDSTLSSGHLITLYGTLTVFEKERLSILEQLKILEEKLFAMDGEEPSSNLEDVEHFSEENGLVLNGHYGDLGKYENGFVNHFSDALDVHASLHLDQISMGYRAKRLLPLFDTISLENEDVLYTKQDEFDASPKSVSKFTLDQKKLAIEEEVDNIYERLQALEADREFLKHCVSSLKKGDKGMHLLQEILQHLRDLRNVELRVRNAGDALASSQPNQN